MMNYRMNRMALLALALLLIVAVAASATADDDGAARGRGRKGIFLGLNAGWGGASFQSKTGDQTLLDDPFDGATGGLRAGYAFSNSFALSLEGYGFGTPEDRGEWGLGAAFLTATWWPGGSGFFLRFGVGAGGGDVMRRDDGTLVHFEEKAAGLFGFGYEWQIGRKTALGLAVDGIGFDLDGASGLEDDVATSSSFSIQFNWYL